MKKKILAAIATLTILAVPSLTLAQSTTTKNTLGKPGMKNIVEIVLQNDGEFDVLQAAVVKAGLVDALSGPGKLTVFAPTDAAFVKTLGVANEAAAIAAVQGLPVEALTDILLYHVAEGRLGVIAVLLMPKYKMLNGDFLTRWEVLKAGVAMVNVNASNGVIHVINSVLMPK